MVREIIHGKELCVNCPNNLGVLAEITRIMSDHAICIDAISGYTKEAENEAEILLVTADNTTASEVLSKNGFNPIKERDIAIIEMENNVGALKNIARKIEEAGINIKHIYGSSVHGSVPVRVIIASEDIQKLLIVFK